jgi:hypothetical protein
MKGDKSMAKYKILVKIDGQDNPLYTDLESIFYDLALIDNKIKVVEIFGGYRIKKDTVGIINNLTSHPRSKNRLARICMAIDYDIKFDVYINDELKFTSIYDLIYILTNLKNDNNKTDISYFKNKIIETTLDNSLLSFFEDAVDEYQNAKLIANIIDSYYEDQEDKYL